MDLFGHAAASLLVGRAIPSQIEDRRGTTAAALLAGMSPDIDAALYLGGADLFLRFHQLYTHNIVAVVVLPLLVATALTRFTRTAFSTLLATAYVAVLAHIACDLIGLWPVPLGFPFMEQRWALFWLEQDFAWPLDAVLVVAAAVSCYGSVAARPWAVRGVASVAMLGVLALLPVV
jgi:membrane-bound metal-dependent hydrolase YbcI (DUF457 family)